MKKYLKYISVAFCVGVLAYLLIPTPEFKDHYSTVIYDRDEQLLGAQIAEDGQWRFPKIDTIPEYYKMAILTFEDKRFYEHRGIDFLSLSRAIIQNIKARKVISGASTLTMQVCRMSRGNTPRTIPQKLIEMAMALKTELHKSKEDILELHASHAPFGGNVVGLEAASWRYYAKPPEQLGLAESALLAVLPNAPALIHPGRNRTALKSKRDRLLKKLYDASIIDRLSYELALLEGLPVKPKPLPKKAPHLLQHIQLNPNATAKTTTTINSDIQNTILKTAEIFSKEYQQSDIQNIGILVLDTQSGDVLGYVGNSPNTHAQAHVDMIQSGRSSGSVLKPLLYAHGVDEGIISPSGLVKDTPVHYNGYRPRNYNKNFAGAVKADEALRKSLNIPAVQLLQAYKVGRFISKLKSHGFSSINKSADHYGLSLILGSADVNLWELTSSYASLARILNTYKNDQSRYKKSDVRPATYTKQEVKESSYEYDPPLLSAAAIHHTFEAMQKVSRPNQEGDWQSFSSAKNIAWKTGTSYGHRDAWAIGVSPQYSIGVWVGNADGEGKHDLVGIKKAAPVLFDVLNHLDFTTDFPIPYDDLVPTVVCSTSGFKATNKCTHTDTVFQIEKSLSHTCPYHVKVTLDKDGYLVNGQCAFPSQMIMESFFTLPSDVAHYYRKNHPEYRNLPDYRSDCTDEENSETIKFIYPSTKSKIYLPTDGNGEKEKAIFKVAHQKPDAKLFWHLNNQYLGMTEEHHSMAITALAGTHKIRLIDQDGHQATQHFEIISEQ